MSKTYLFLTLLSIVLQGLFAFFEMACVSFNKVRLQYYVSRGGKRALWLNYLIKRPSRLFGTTLIGITSSLVVGSECARRFYESIHLDPDLAPITQVPLVVIFGELAPMFAARRHPEQAAMFCVPLMAFLAKILTPVTWTFDFLSKAVHRLMGKKEEVPLFLSREEIRMAFEEKEGGGDEMNTTIYQIFQLKNATAGQLMTPLEEMELIDSHMTLSEIRHLLSVQFVRELPVFHKDPQNIVAIATLRDLLILEENQRVLDVAKSPWFVTKDTSVLQLLQQFRTNNQSTSVILDPTGRAIGFLTLDQILSTIFREEKRLEGTTEPSRYIERTLSAQMLVEQFNSQFDASLVCEKEETISDLLLKNLDHFPVKEESVRIGEFEFTIEDLFLRSIKTVSVRTVRD